MTWIEPDRVDFALYLAARPSNGRESGNGVGGTMNKDFGMTRLFRPFFIAFSLCL